MYYVANLHIQIRPTNFDNSDKGKENLCLVYTEISGYSGENPKHTEQFSTSFKN